MLWVSLIVLPLAVSLMVWKFLVAPQKVQLDHWRDKQLLIELKPKLEMILKGSKQLLSDSQQTGFVEEDPAAVMQAIERIARERHVEVREIRSNDKTASKSDEEARNSIPGFKTIPLDLEVQGNFDKLARWIGEVENQVGLQVDSWSMAPSTELNQPHRLTLRMTAYLRGRT